MQPESYVAISCLWLLGGLGILWFALAKLRFGPIQALLVAAGLCSAAAGLCNGLVILANGYRMPVERVYWPVVPAYFDAPDDREGFFCRIVIGVDDAVMPGSDGRLHMDVPRQRIVHGSIAVPAESPNLAFLDDRHGLQMCGEQMIYSKGDLLGAMGVAYLFAGTWLLFLAFLWKRFRRKKKIPT